MKKVYIFGTGSTGRRIYKDVRGKCQVLGFLDNDKKKWGGIIDDIPIIGDVTKVIDLDYDEIIVCSLPAMQTIKEQLIGLGIPAQKINTEYILTQVQARINFLKDFANLYQDDARECSVAEGGVYQGEFAKEINKCFPNNKLYLFDTFEGFDQRDTDKEHKEGMSIFEKGHLSNTSVEMVLGKMSFKEKVVIKKGYFPETISGLEKETFFFVNLDFDLYNPTLDGLRFFYPRLKKNGIILIHDYYNPGYEGIKKAIDDFETEINNKLHRIPIGDHCSISIVK